MSNSADPDQLASSLFAKAAGVYPGSAGQDKDKEQILSILHQKYLYQ